MVDDGQAKVRVGLPVCEGPGTYRLLLTHPHQVEGQILEIPRDQIEAVERLSPRPRGDVPD